IQKSTGYSPYYIAHGVEPLLPFDLAEATYMAPTPSKLMSTQDLVISRAIQLQKCMTDLEIMKHHLVAARWASVHQFEKSVHLSIIDFDFKPGALVLVCNSALDKMMDKVKPQHFGPMVVIQQSKAGTYILRELDGSLSKLRYAAFQLIPYHPQSQLGISIQDFFRYSHRGPQ
ncbi:hypothetical protein L208DRAFT_1287364, partial [Tricholoma matsutake]